MSPLFVVTILSIIEKIEPLIIENLSSKDLYILDLSLTGSGRKKLSIVLDGELEGVSIDECAKISRIVGSYLEEHELIEDAYQLEVSSPGIDIPLTQPRQYTKNVGRDLTLHLDGKEISGRLDKVTTTGIEISAIKMRGKLKAYAKESTAIEFEKIDKANILISFN